MKHEMKLKPSPFYAMKKGLKKIEMRLNDEKRKGIKIGDEIEFTNQETNEKILTRVVNLTLFKDFYELYSHFDKALLGYEKDQVAHYTDMSQYYKEAEIEKYGTLAIEIELKEIF